MLNKGPNQDVSKPLGATSSPIEIRGRKFSTPLPIEPNNRRFQTSSLASSMPADRGHLDSFEESDDEGQTYGEIFDFTYKPRTRIPQPQPAEKAIIDAAKEQKPVSDPESLEGGGAAEAASAGDSLFRLEEDDGEPMLNAFGRFMGPRTQAEQDEDDVAILGTRPEGARRLHPKGY